MGRHRASLDLILHLLHFFLHPSLQDSETRLRAAQSTNYCRRLQHWFHASSFVAKECLQRYILFRLHLCDSVKLKPHRIIRKLSVRDVDQHDLTYHSDLRTHSCYFPYECKPQKIRVVAQNCTLGYLLLLPDCLSRHANSYNVVQRHSLGFQRP